jgi:tetratricopeptide (TPR) repeat protein
MAAMGVVMWKNSVIAIAFFAALAGSSSANAQASATGFWMVLDNCQNRKLDPDIRIKMCTEIIHSNMLIQGILAAIYEERAEAYWAKGDTDNALKDFAKSIALKPDFSQAFANRGDMLMGLGRAKDADSDFERAGYFHLLHKECDASINDYGKALRIDPKLAVALYGRGLCEKRSGKDDAAQKDMDAALALDPSIAQTGNWPAGN